MTRQDALGFIVNLSPGQREAVAMVVETAEIKENMSYSDQNGVRDDDAQATLNAIAREIREAKR